MNFPRRNSAAKAAGVSIFGLVLLFLVWVAGDSESLRANTRDSINPFLVLSEGVKNIFSGPGRFFSSRNSLDKKISELEASKGSFEVENIILSSRVKELERLLNFPQSEGGPGKMVLVSSRAESAPFGTLIISFDQNSGVSKGMKALGYGGVYLGEVSEVGARSAVVKLVTYPGLETEGWLERMSLSITLEGYGGNNLKFSLPKSVKVEAGDKIISNTSPQYLIGQVEFVEERPTEPLQEILLRLPLNLRNLRYVELRN
ncbi:hypothetical protein A3B18_01905 [Candidatus Giovannonibacteria bacterium RIFCSPLOWO2_01_FULL_46_13]|uniref:Cell shape-determining protein MreC n=1 Tax=Candidatus Giovannonibacteria bacterium RIFCSPLOWO2_01_FULL_46_13 TaxID=1798352 RepID=A0A1F5X2X3_9BACT|nr:MAG: hypothetical protein A3B18_01905 [Candidatus Giovannonibacteria bacterium RIFCSPLOWO2_01_FULL_46_13]